MIRKADVSLVCRGMDGGIGTYTLNMYKGLSKKGYRVHLVCLERDLQYLENRLPESDILITSSPDYRKGVSCMGRYLEAAQPKVLITPQLRPTIIALRARAAFNPGTRIYPVIHSTYSEEFRHLPVSKRFFRLLRLRYHYKKCDGIIAVSAGAAGDFTRMTGISESAVSVVYNPVNTSEILSRAAQPLHHPWFNNGQPPVVLGIGRLVWEKNFQMLIEAFEIVRSRIASRLMILGDGPHRQKLERRIQASPFSGDISMPGRVPNPYQFIRRSALLTLSSNYEGLPTVLIEALASGTPVVSTDCPNGPREILKDGKYGQIVSVNKPEKLADAMIQTLGSPLSSKVLKKRALNFDIDSSVANYLRLFGLTDGS
ncbi:MAG: glycosyltransferase [bacterium]|nr:glycosyltransferase [bacterium]MDT8365280.1 glycosyltransferase [bacterium]